MTREEHTEYMRRYRVEKRDKMLAYYRERRRRKAAERGPITATCAGCGKTFVKTGHHQRFCSAACRRRRAGVSVVCKMCGKTFTAKTVRARFCSRSCNRAYFLGRRKKPVMSKTCPNCGKAFETTDPRKVYCTAACQQTAYHKARRKPAQTHVCVFCARHFTAKTSRARFCSTLCERRANRLGYATLADFERAQAERKAASHNQRRERDRNGLTLAQVQAVIDAQDGAPERCWQLSQGWTDAQRKYAKKRYEEMHGLFPLRFSL